MRQTKDEEPCTRLTIDSGDVELELALKSNGDWRLTQRGGQTSRSQVLCSGTIESVVWPATKLTQREIRRGELLIDLERRHVFMAGRRLELTAREFELLATLATRPNRVFTINELQHGAFGSKTVLSPRTISTHASRLRVKLQAAGGRKLILNSHGVGYRFSGAGPE